MKTTTSLLQVVLTLEASQVEIEPLSVEIEPLSVATCPLTPNALVGSLASQSRTEPIWLKEGT